ncbi:MAG: hypothetical protein KDD38_10705 [Bdellovibrionales bacterium]|nr:hypothetical protein [Bdellovibrionales bacterium]
MLIDFRVATMSLFVIPALFAFSTARAELSPEQPSVVRSTIVCDRWQWIGNGATTWGCLYTPREAFVAGGQATDEVVADLQKQINDLNERLKKLEHK